VVRLGVVPAINTIETVEIFQPLMDYLSKKLKARVELVVLEDYDSIVNKMETGELEGGIHGSFSAYIVQKKLGAIPVARPEKNGVSTYRGLIFTRKDSGIEKIADLEGKSFVYTDRKTSAGGLYPLYVLKKEGYDAANFFGKTTYAGRQDLAVLAVLNKDGDAGAAKDTTFFDLAKENPRIDAEMVIISTSSAQFPEKSLVVRKDLDPKLVKKMKKVLLGMDHNAEGRDVLERLGADRYIESHPSDWADLEEMIKFTEYYLD
jgi:phosphonate transport system substrate-binding protein